MQSEFDRLFLRGKISEDEYCALAMNEGQIVAVAVDEMDRITTVSMSLNASGYNAEVLYSPDVAKPDEKFLSHEKNFAEAKAVFSKRIRKLESTGLHRFDTVWFTKQNG